MRPALTRILIIKTGALGDVLRTTSILPGLHARHPGCAVTWVTAAAARPLVEHHPLVASVETFPDDDERRRALASVLSATPWDQVISLDDEEALCRLAASVPCERLAGATLAADGRCVYTDDVAEWFDMGLISRHGKAEADRRKVANRRSHPAIYADMLGIAPGQPELPVPASELSWAQREVQRWGIAGARPLLGLNTGAGGRWPSKGLDVDRVAALVADLAAEFAGAAFLLLGGPDERERQRDLADACARAATAARVIDAGTDHPLLRFAALVSQCDLLVTSDSLALHVAIARRRGIVAFFAPTSAAEIELFGLGEKVVSTAADYCSYRPDTDNSTITPERLAAACRRVWRARSG